MGVDVAYVMRLKAGFFQGQLHAEGSLCPVRLRGCNMVAVLGVGIACQGGIRLSSAPCCMLSRFQQDSTAAFTYDKAVPVLVKRTGGMQGIVVSVRQCLGHVQAADKYRGDNGFPADAQDCISLA